MKFLVLLLALFSLTAKAGDMAGASFGVGQGSMPMYGADYEFINSLGGYADVSFFANRQTVQPGVSFGVQGKALNLGIVFSNNISNIAPQTYSSGGLNIGGELGYQHNLVGPFYVKENNQYVDVHGTFYFGSTLGLGLNL